MSNVIMVVFFCISLIAVVVATVEMVISEIKFRRNMKWLDEWYKEQLGILRCNNAKDWNEERYKDSMLKNKVVIEKKDQDN